MPAPGPIDTHAHLSACMEDAERRKALSSAAEAGLEGVIDVGIDLPSSRAAAELASCSPLVFAAAGIHPNAEDGGGDLSQLRRLLTKPRVVAVGETGLDRSRQTVPADLQWTRFEYHLSLAEELSLPAIIHSREAEADCISAARQRRELKAVFHSFTGAPKEVEDIIEAGFFISFTGIVTFPSAEKVRGAARLVPIDRLLLETDSPYLAPQPVRGKPNQPAYVLHTAEKLAEILGYSVRDVLRATSVNARLLFGLGGLPAEPALAYPIRDSLYLNITSRCSNDCTFCLRKFTDYVAGHRLRLENEPTARDVIAAVESPLEYKEVVFCGLGEPTEKLSVVLEVGRWLKEHGAVVRLDTNGQGDLINGKNVLASLRGIVDKVSVSLNGSDAETYQRVCRSRFGAAAYGSVIEFIRRAVKVIPDVEVTSVQLPGVDIDACRHVAESLGARFRKRRLLRQRRL